jgi:O-antigen/teichoic acid export membrane protein
MALLSAGEGALFVYYIGFRIYSSLQSVIGGTIATVATRGYRGVCWNTTILFALIKKSVVQVAAYTVPVAVCIWVFGAHFLDFVYGEKLGRQNVALATVVLDVLSLGLFFQTLHVVVASIWLFAGHAWVLTFMNVAYATSFSILVWWAAPIWGALGISVMVASGAVLLAIGNIALLSKSIRSRSM